MPLCNNDFEEVQKEDNYLKGDALGLSSIYHFTEWLQMKSCTDIYDSKRMYPTGFGGQLTFLLALHFYFFVKVICFSSSPSPNPMIPELLLFCSIRMITIAKYTLSNVLILHHVLSILPEGQICYEMWFY